MSEEQRRQLQQQLCNIANTYAARWVLMNLGLHSRFIFYKYLSEKIQRYADSMLEEMALNSPAWMKTARKALKR